MGFVFCCVRPAYAMLCLLACLIFRVMKKKKKDFFSFSEKMWLVV